MTTVHFPTNPTDGMIFEPASGIFYRYDASTQSWIRIDTTTVPLATPYRSGKMSAADYNKLSSVMVPPPQSSLDGEDCDITFRSGTVTLYSGDQSLEVSSDLQVGGVSQPWQISENTAGYDFSLNLEQFIAEIEDRGAISKAQISGPDGTKGDRGLAGVDRLNTGPQGEDGDPGVNSPFAGSFLPDAGTLEVDGDKTNKAIVDISTEKISSNENYLVVTRANIGNPDACPNEISPQDFESPWLLVLDKKEANVKRKLESASGDQTIICKVCVSQVYYLDIESIVSTVKDRFDARLNEIKYEKEKVVRSWLKVMSALFSEQKYALCCALENCVSRKRNQDTRRYIEQSRILAAGADQALVISSDKQDKVTVPGGGECDAGEVPDSDSRVVYGEECDQYLVTMSLDARIHTSDPRSNRSKRWLEARLPPGDYLLAELDCCANFGRKQPVVPVIQRTPPPLPAPQPPPSQPPAPKEVPPPPPPQVLVPPRVIDHGSIYDDPAFGGSGGYIRITTTMPGYMAQGTPGATDPLTSQFSPYVGSVPQGVGQRYGAPGDSITTGIRAPYESKGPKLTGKIGNQPGDRPARGYPGFIGDDCKIYHGHAHSLLVNGCIPKTKPNTLTVTPDSYKTPNKYSGRVSLMHYGPTPGADTGSDRTEERVVSLPSVGPQSGFFEDLLAARQAYIGLTTIFSHSGGVIKVWIPDPDKLTTNNDGGIVIGIRSRKCVEEPEVTGTDQTVVLPKIYIYRDSLVPDNIVGTIDPYITATTHEENYGGGTQGKFLKSGPILEPEISKMFMVMADDGLAFYHLHHADSDESLNTTIFAKYSIEGNNTSVYSIADDDTGDVVREDGPNGEIFTAEWQIEDDIDGLVLSPLDPDDNDDWVIYLDNTDFGAMKRLVATSGDDNEFVLSQGPRGTAIPELTEAEPFILCRALRRECNVKEGFGGRYALGIVNRVKGVNFRVCRELDEWSTDSWISKPYVYAPTGEPCGASFCDVPNQVLIGGDGQYVSRNESGEDKPVIDGSKVNIAWVIDQSYSMRFAFDYLSEKVDDLATFILNSDTVDSLRYSVVTYGGPDENGDPVLRQDFTDNIDLAVGSIDESEPPDEIAGDAPGLYAVQWATNTLDWEPDAVKIIVLVTDSPSSPRAGITTATVLAALQDKGVVLNGVIDLMHSRASVSYYKRCESWEFKYAECPGSRPIDNAWVHSRESYSECIRGYSFGIRQNGTLWVSHGCRAVFEVEYAGVSQNPDPATHRSPTEDYGVPGDYENPELGGVGLCYDSEGTVFSLDDMRNADIDEALTNSADGYVRWNIQPFKDFRLGVGSAKGGVTAQTNIGNNMPSTFYDGVDYLRSTGFHLLTGRFKTSATSSRSLDINGGLVHLKSSLTGSKVIMSTTTDARGYFVFQVPVGFFPRSAITFTVELAMYNLEPTGGWDIGTKTSAGLSQTLGISGGRGIGGDGGVGDYGAEQFVTDAAWGVATDEGALTSLRGINGSRSKVPDDWQRVSDVRSDGGRLTFDLAFDDDSSDFDFNDLIIEVKQREGTNCLPTSGSIDSVVKVTRQFVVNDIHNTFYANPNPGTNNFAAGGHGGGWTDAGDLIFNSSELSTVRDNLACSSVGFFSQFAAIKLKEIEDVASPDPGVDCGYPVNGGPSLIYTRVDGIPMTQDTLEGRVVAIQASVIALPGTSIRASIYDKYNRGMALRAVTTLPASSWEWHTWHIDNVDYYINHNVINPSIEESASGFAPQDAVPPGLREPSDSPDYTKGTLGAIYNARTSTSDGQSVVTTDVDDRYTSESGRIDMFTKGLDITLQDLKNVSFEFINPDSGTICYFGTVKAAVERISDPLQGTTEVVVVDISNFEPFGESKSDPGEIPLAVFVGVLPVQSGVTDDNGGYASSVLFFNSQPENYDQILLGHPNKSQVAVFVDSLVTDSSAAGYKGNQVLIGAALADTIANLESFANSTGTPDTVWHNAILAQGFEYWTWEDNTDTTVSLTTADSVTFVASEVGIAGNGYVSRVQIGTTRMYFGTSVFTGGVDPQEEVEAVFNSTEEDISAYLENWWTISSPDTLDNPNVCTRWKEFCPDCTVVKCDNTGVGGLQREEIECIDKTDYMSVPLNRFLITPIGPCESCLMHWKRVEWYERGWRTSACCGATVEVDGVKWIVVKRSIGVDTSCGGGESENTECIKQFIEAGMGHPAIAWPTADGEEFIGRPESGFVRFVRDANLSDDLIEAIGRHQASDLRGNVTASNIAEKIPFIIFPKSV